jgi:hypothetical protein
LSDPDRKEEKKTEAQRVLRVFVTLYSKRIASFLGSANQPALLGNVFAGCWRVVQHFCPFQPVV